MKQPHILLSAGSKSGAADNYVRAIQAAGGVPIGGYCPQPSVEGVDGVLLCGGSDLAPERYGQTLNGSEAIDPARDEAEWNLLAACVRLQKPVLGICRGHQIVNAYFGGTLIQHIGDELCIIHRRRNGVDGIHPIRIADGSLLGSLYGDSCLVNSAHHQAVGELAPDLRATAWSESGLVEALEHKTLPIWCVQFHPERMSLEHQNSLLADGMKIFLRFMEFCR